MTAHRRYTFTYAGPVESGWVDRVRVKLESASNQHWWFAEPEVSTSVEGMAFSIQVTARDQWFAHKRVMALAEDVCWVLKIPVPEPVWETLPPHTNRGRYRKVPASAGAGDS